MRLSPFSLLMSKTKRFVIDNSNARLAITSDTVGNPEIFRIFAAEAIRYRTGMDPNCFTGKTPPGTFGSMVLASRDIDLESRTIHFKKEFFNEIDKALKAGTFDSVPNYIPSVSEDAVLFRTVDTDTDTDTDKRLYTPYPDNQADKFYVASVLVFASLLLLKAILGYHNNHNHRYLAFSEVYWQCPKWFRDPMARTKQLILGGAINQSGSFGYSCITEYSGLVTLATRNTFIVENISNISRFLGITF